MYFRKFTIWRLLVVVIALSSCKGFAMEVPCLPQEGTGGWILRIPAAERIDQAASEVRELQLYGWPYEQSSR